MDARCGSVSRLVARPPRPEREYYARWNSARARKPGFVSGRLFWVGIIFLWRVKLSLPEIISTISPAPQAAAFSAKDDED